MKTAELTGAALDWAVAKCEGVPEYILNKPYRASELIEGYATDWAQGGPIIEREGMQLWIGQNWNASMDSNNINPHNFESGTTPLIAAMRCYVTSKLGEDIDIPKELL